MSNNNESLVVAQTILEQLGGRRFLAMTGAKNLLGDENSLQFQLPRDPGFVKDGITNVRIELVASDTYALTFFKVRGIKIIEIAKDTDVYADMLRRVFTERTALECTLGTMRG